MANKKQTTRRQNRGNLLPGESRRTSTVAVDYDGLEALYYGIPVELLDKQRGDRATIHYIVVTERLDGVWRHRIETDGKTWKFPAQVVKRLVDQRDSIIKAERSQRATDRAAKARGEELPEETDQPIMEKQPETTAPWERGGIDYSGIGGLTGIEKDI